jgi:hypothetical protein
MADLQASLRRVLLEWDPIGVADFAPDDEYDCMIGPLLGLLSRGGSAVQVRDHLWHVLEDHFGQNPVHGGIDAVADRLVAWWSTVRPG